MIIYLCHTGKFILSHSDSLRSNCRDLGTCWRKLQLMIVDGDSATLSGSLKYCKACHGSAYSTKNKTQYENCSYLYFNICIKGKGLCVRKNTLTVSIQYKCTVFLLQHTAYRLNGYSATRLVHSSDPLCST